MKQVNYYTDEYNNEIKLTHEELQFFTSTVDKVKSVLNIECDIYNYDHDLLIGKSKDAFGVCYTSNFETYEITIDNYFIHECFQYGEKPYLKLLNDGETLESVICHEIAHLEHFRHGKKHKDLTQKYMNKIMEDMRMSSKDVKEDLRDDYYEREMEEKALDKIDERNRDMINNPDSYFEADDLRRYY